MTMALMLPGQVVPRVPLSWPLAKGWIYSYVRTDHPGYRRLAPGGAPMVIASGTYRWDLFVAELVAQLIPRGGGGGIDGGGGVFLDTVSATCVWPDRLGWLLGFGVEAGATTTGEPQSLFVPPGGIPLMGVSWDEVTIEREREQIVDAARRHAGYVFGGARLWRCGVQMSGWAYEALAQRWCLRGQVTLLASSLTAMSASVSDGALTGSILGLAGVEWAQKQRLTCKATLIVAGNTT